MRTAVIRADGSLTIGYGHIFRTLVLAEELRNRGWNIIYVCRDLSGAPLDRIRNAGLELQLLAPGLDEREDAAETARISELCGASWIVVDRYDTDDSAYCLWSKTGLKILAIDDICQHPFPVDVLLNQNANALLLPYETGSDTICLFGPSYALIRAPYRHARPEQPRKSAAIRNVMVFMGGGDPNDVTGKVVEAIEKRASPLTLEVIVGAAYPHYQRLLDLTQRSHHQIRILRDIPDLVPPMARADIAISSAGSVTWELACMGVPMVLIAVADNQVDNALFMKNGGYADFIGHERNLDANDMSVVFNEIFSKKQIDTELPRKLWSFVDGAGVHKIADTMNRSLLH